MGRQTIAAVRIGEPAAVTTTVLLEPGELILRGALKARWPLLRLQRLRVEDGMLCFEDPEGRPVQLQLGALEAGRWLSRMQTPPPTLAAKLGVGASRRAVTFGAVDEDSELAAALRDARTEDRECASCLVARVDSLTGLDQALALHATLPCRLLWVVNEKGPRSPLGEDAIRARLRSFGYKDSKTCAVSVRLSATRYAKA